LNLVDLLPPNEDGVKQFLEWQQEVFTSPAKYLGLVGGVGSGKTIVECILGLALSIQIPGNRGIVLRRTYQKLHDATETVFLEVLQRAEIRGVKFSQNWSGYPHLIRLPNDSEIHFRESKDRGRYLGPEYGWFLLDEALEEPEETIKGLMTRLRLGRARGFLKGMVATNPPPRKSWFVNMFGLRPGIKEVREPHTGVTTKYHLIRSSTRQNIHLPPGYLGDLLATNTDPEIARIVDGHYGFTQDGPPVYPQFKIAKHVRDDCFKVQHPVIRGWDFGFHHPAVTWHQLWWCKRRRLHWSIHHEVDASDVEAKDFIQSVMIENAVCFPGLSRLMFLDGGDRAGAQASDKGPGPIIRAAGSPWFLRIKHRACPIEPGLDLVRQYLIMDCPCGLPAMTIDPSCINVLEGFLGGYHYPKNYHGLREEVPFKDRYFDDFMDSVRYVGENFVRMEEKGPGFLDNLMSENAGVSGLSEEKEGAWLMEGASW
jgi:phage terminase large subunit